MLAKLLAFLAPNPAGALWIGLIVALVAAADYSTWRARRNLALALLLANAVLLAPCLRWGPFPEGLGPKVIFTGIWLVTGACTVWAFLLMRRGTDLTWTPNLPRRGLQALVAVLLALDVAVVLGRAPDDAGIYSNLGAQRWVETGVLPYGDAALKGPKAPAYGAAATYGPVLYAAHVPFQLLLGARNNPPEVAPMTPAYVWPKALATKAACLAFFFAGLGALFVIVRRLADTDRALMAVALYAGSPYVMGLGSDDYVLTGLRFISHIAPSSLVLLALAAYARPALSGACLALATGALFWPVFLAPAWLGWRLWRREDPVRFALGFGGTMVALVALVVWFTHAPEGTTTLEMFLASTIEHQEGRNTLEYGASKVGFWGQHPGLAAILHQPIIGSSSIFKPTFLAFLALCGASFFFARGRTIAQLAAVTAVIAAGIQLYKTHAAGSYVEWYYPFLLIALIGGSVVRAATTDPATQTVPGG